jgi:transcriptional regulator GlxA family with amidase domain
MDREHDMDGGARNREDAMTTPAVRTRRNGAAPAKPRLSVGFILAENFTLSAFSLFVDQLRLAADEGDLSRPINCQWTIMGSRAEPVTASCGVTVSRTSGFVDPSRFDYIAVVGGILHGGKQVDDATMDYLRSAARAGVPLVGLCTGSFILARAGLMTGRRVCVNWYHYQDFLAEFPHHTPVADRLSVADLASWIVERSLGRAVAQKSRQILVLDQARPGTAAQPHPPLADSIGDERVRRALLLMEQHLADPLLIADIAVRLQLSTRQLERLFQSVLGMRPAAFYRSLRLKYARWLLDNTDRSVTDIALEAGFSDCAHFSRHFKALHGFSPSDGRSRESARARAAEEAGLPPPSVIEIAGVRLFE